MGGEELVWNQVGSQGQAQGCPQIGVGGDRRNNWRRRKLCHHHGRRWESVPQRASSESGGPWWPWKPEQETKEAGGGEVKVMLMDSAANEGVVMRKVKGRWFPPRCVSRTGAAETSTRSHCNLEAKLNSGDLPNPFPMSQRQVLFSKTF